MEDYILHIEKLNKYFTDPVSFHVLKDINLKVKKGEFASVVGKSGCGKSTLLYILSTMDTNYQGSLFIKNKLVTGKTPNELARIRSENIGFVFQFHYLLPEFSVLDNVMMPARKLGRKSYDEIREDALEKLRLLDILNEADKKASRISGGQKQRVSIARALINDPIMIMGDEPTGNLDSKNANNVFNIFKSLSDSVGLSLLIVTHDMDFANKTDRIIEMGDGEIIS